MIAFDQLFLEEHEMCQAKKACYFLNSLSLKTDATQSANPVI